MKPSPQNGAQRDAMAQLRANLAKLEHSPSILLIDDSKHDLELMQRTLLQFSNTMLIVSARDMDEALAAITSVPFDLVFLDLLFPAGPTGIDILKRIKQASSVPVLVLTGADPHDKLVSQAIPAGAAGVFPKPLTRETISLIFATP